MVAPVTYDSVLKEEGRTQLIVQMKGNDVVGYIIRLNGTPVDIADDFENAKLAFSRARFTDEATAKQ